MVKYILRRMTMEVDYARKGVAGAGLGLGIAGTALGLLNGGGGILNLGGWGNNGCCHENTLINRYELGLQQQLAAKDSEIALRDANIYNDQKSLEMYRYIDGRMREVESVLAQQAVQNQANRDSFQLMQERLDCCKNEMCSAITRERDERRCADNTLVTYMNATFYPKQVADVTVGTTMTAQTTYNPLPACTCGNGCSC